MTADFFLICENPLERYKEHGTRYKEMLVPFTHLPTLGVACLLVACSLLLVASFLFIFRNSNINH
jgi:hypothetical protein